MDFFKSGLKTVLGAQEPGQQPSGAETVERLVERVSHSTLLEDRRDACRALKALSRKYRLEVGTQAMEALRQVLELDRADNETISYALDALANVVSPAGFEEEQADPRAPRQLGEQFTEIFIKDHDNIQLLLDLLDEHDFRVRLAAVQLLTALLTNRPKDLQEIVLVKPMGVSKMMDLLSDSREVIRNETLLLLIKLTKGNANIQKIIAFENAFDRLFEIVSSEGYSDGGIIVEDCLRLMLNLLKNNSSNINFFKEGSYIQRMLPMFSPPQDEEAGWSAQKVSNVHCMLQLARALVAPASAARLVASCQQLMRSAGLLQVLCDTLMASGVPADVLTETISTVGEVVRGCAPNQQALGQVTAPSNPPRPAVVVLLMSMVNEKQPFSLRCAVLYCFQCYLYHNEASQASLVQTLLPSSTDVSALTAGQLLCGGLFSPDVLSNWFAAVALSHALVENPAQKEQLLRVLLATNAGSAPVTLLHQCTVLLQQSTRLQAKVALLMLLAQWTAYCPAAVATLLRSPGTVSYLVNQTSSNEHDDNESLLQGLSAFLLAVCVLFNDDSVDSYSADALRQLLLKRIGLETFSSKLSEVSRHEAYGAAAKAPAPRARDPARLLLDYEFCRLFKVLESVVVAGLSPAPEASPPSPPPPLEQYRGLIREQDARLQQLRAELEPALRRLQTLQSALNDSLEANSALKDENTLLKAQLSASIAQPTQQNDTGVTGTASASGASGASGATAAASDSGANEYRIQQLTSQVEGLTEALRIEKQSSARATEELEKLRKDQDDLLELLADQDSKLSECKLRLMALGQSVDEPAEAT